MSKKNLTYGFGFDPLQGQNHFYVLNPQTSEDSISIYERYGWTQGEEQKIVKSDVLRLEISKHKWNLVSKELTVEFNSRLKKDNIKQGRFIIGGTPLERLLGKEMMVLLWGIEDSDPGVIPVAVRNWKGLMPEERWWLYTMTNASTGHISDKKGWRTALRFALCENPVVERHQLRLNELFSEEK